MIELESNEAFKIATKHTKSTSRQINSNWLINNGYTKKRKQIDGIRKTYYLKQN